MTTADLTPSDLHTIASSLGGLLGILGDDPRHAAQTAELTSVSAKVRQILIDAAPSRYLFAAGRLSPVDAGHDGRAIAPEEEGLLDAALLQLREEVCAAYLKHGPLRSLAEGRGALAGEVQELNDDLHRRNRVPAASEAKQVAAVAVRIIVDLCSRTQPWHR